MEIKSLEDEIKLFKKIVDNDNLETTKSPTNNCISVYQFISSDKTFTSLVYLTEFYKLLV